MTHTAQAGDLVFLFSQDYKTFQLILKPGSRAHTHRGIIDHDDLIGQPLGRKLRSHTGHAFWVLEPSTYDLVRQAKRTTQIMYPKDIGYLLLRLNVQPGKRVIECGTGSGGLTLALARAVQPNGMIYSYEYRAEIQDVARENLERLGLLPYCTLTLRDAAEGFDETDASRGPTWSRHTRRSRAAAFSAPSSPPPTRSRTCCTTSGAAALPGSRSKS
jgi:tRNA (adenine57-N1/adenine58-N1)-methyltransferase